MLHLFGQTFRRQFIFGRINIKERSQPTKVKQLTKNSAVVYCSLNSRKNAEDTTHILHVKLETM